MSSWDDLLERFTSGELDRESPEIVAACKEAGFREELRSTTRLMDALDEDTLLEQARQLEAVPGEERVAQMVEERLRRVRRPRLLRWLAPLLVAAGVVPFCVFRGGAGEEGGVEPIPLGTRDLRCDAPTGANASFEEFRWSHEADDGDYEITVFDSEGEVVAGGSSGRMTGARSWRPRAEDVRTWPDRITWRLRWHPGGGGTPVQVYGEAER